MTDTLGQGVVSSSAALCEAGTLIDLLRANALHDPEKPAYTFLLDGEDQEACLTYGDLDRQARSIAITLQNQGITGGRALLVYPPGLDFIAGFFGCLYAGVVAVPAYPPDPARLGRTLPRLRAIAADAQPAIALTTQPVLEAARQLLGREPRLNAFRWLATDSCPAHADDWVEPYITGGDLAFLQYTSGSTGSPKGVMLTHANLLHNAAMVFSAFEHPPEARYVSWLPTFHDMGFMAGVLEPLYAGVPIIGMSPASFLEQPARWLRAISRYKATISGGPNFAYDLCARKVSEGEKSRLDLSSWTVAFNGAEPVRAETLDRFSAAFEPCGFRQEAFYPCYGLAEATLIVTGGDKSKPPILRALPHTDRGTEQEGGSASGGKLLVGCGRPLLNQLVRIVDPDRMTECPHGRVGEIWVSGPSVARGYWQRRDETRAVFEAFLSGGEGPFLRTGDLGFLSDGELFVTGRLKDLIIIRGVNHYPQDIELTVERCHPSLKPGCGAAFSVEGQGEERLVVVQEVEPLPQPELDSVIDVIEEATLSAHELQLYGVVLIKPGTILKTSSGKIRRHACRDAFLRRVLEVVTERNAPACRTLDSAALLSRPDLDSLETWLAALAAAQLGIEPGRLNLNQPILRYGLDSLAAVELARSIGDAIGVDLPAAALLRGPTLTNLAAEVRRRVRERGEAGSAIPIKGGFQSEYPLSHGQSGVWSVHQLEPESAVFNIARVVRIKSQLDVTALHCAFQALVDRHACLRTTVASAQGRVLQRARDHVEVDFALEDAIDWSEALFTERLANETRRPFDLERGPLFRVRLFTRSRSEHVLTLCVHHIVADFWSLAVMMHELGLLYEARISGLTASLPRLGLHYSDYVSWQTELLSGEEGERLWEYWRDLLAAELPVLSLQTDRPRAAVQTYRGASRGFRLGPDLTERLKSLGSIYGATLYSSLIAGFQALLHRYTGQQEVVLGSPMSGRRRAEFEPLVGYFANMVVIRSRFDEGVTFASVLGRTHEAVVEAFDRQDYPFPLLVERLRLRRDPRRPPIFQTAFTFQQSPFPSERALSLIAVGDPGARVTLGGLEIEAAVAPSHAAQYEITLMMAESECGLAGAFEYNTDLFDDATIERMAGHFRVLLEGVVENPGRAVAQAPLLTPGEIRFIKDQSNIESAARYPDDLTLHERLEQQANLTPDAIAASVEHACLTYRELNERANKLARLLMKRGAAPEHLVGVCMERSLGMVVGLLAVLKTGAAYAPLDPSYPRERLLLLLEDARVAILVTEQSLVGDFGDSRSDIVCIDRDWSLIESETSENPQGGANTQGPAYVIYTSGSTGRPKGVVVTHYNVTRLFEATVASFAFSDRDVWSVFHTYGFDFSVWELWGALVTGGRAVIVPYWVSRTPEAFWEVIEAERVSVLSQTPSAFLQLVHAEQARPDTGCLSLRLIILGGEALDPRSLDPWFERHGDEKPELVNMYGITETTVHVTSRRITRAVAGTGRSPIGMPLPDLRLYVLDGRQEPAPIGLAGEICVAGAGLTRGYLNQAASTAERFVPDPWSRDPGRRMYRSGDLARRTADGEIEYAGRIDKQVKVRGFRIEPGEIEGVMGAHQAVIRCVVAVKELLGEKRLIAYVQAAPETSVEALRDYLKEWLPDYMIPSAFVMMDAFPLTSHGKIDLGSLPEPEMSRAEIGLPYVAPDTQVERTLAAIWSRVLGLDRIGVHDNFFDLGGDSILSMQVAAGAREAGLALTPRQIFEHQTIREIARVAQVLDEPVARESSTIELAPIEKEWFDRLERENGPIQDVYPLSWAQQGILFHSIYESGSSGLYCTQMVFELRGALNAAAFEAALRSLVARHEVLRASFEWEGVGEPVHVIRRSAELRLDEHDLRALGRQEQESRLGRFLDEDRRKGFNLREAPLMRLALISTADDERWCVWSSHHLLLDGWSASVALREVFDLYDLYGAGGPSEVGKAPSFKDYIAWLREQDYSVAERYWRAGLGGFLAPNDFRLERPQASRPTESGLQAEMESVSANRYSERRTRLPEGITSALESFGRARRLTLSTIVQGAWSIALSRYCGSEDIVFGLTLAGRPPGLQASESMVGVLINTLPLRLSVTPGQRVQAFMHYLQSQTAELRQYEFSSLAQVQGWSEAPRGTPLFESILVFENYPVEQSLPARPGLEICNLRSIEQTNYPLTVAALPGPEMALEIGYQIERFDADTVERMLGHLRALLEGIISSPERRISDLSLLSDSERTQLLVEWNETKGAHSGSLCLHHLFEAQATRIPDAVGVIFEDEFLTFGRLERRANTIARRVCAVGLARGAAVALFLDRGPDLIAALLAVLKTGAVYLPIDPSQPGQRSSFILEDARVELVITTSAFAGSLPSADCADDAEGRNGACARVRARQLYVDRLSDAQTDGKDLDESVSPADPAYVIYTSGSTGRPKGVTVSHGAVSNHMQWLADQFPLSTDDRVLQKYSISFDASISEIFYPLVSGAALVIAPRDGEYDMAYLTDLMCRQMVTSIDVVPTLLTACIEDGRIVGCRSLRQIICGGETLPVSLQEKVTKRLPGVVLANVYGPTEATITAAFHCCDPRSPQRDVPIGRPISNAKLYVLHKDVNPAPIGVIGEIWIGGQGLALGYLNRPDLTAERFIPDPFAAEPGERFYRTGDLGCHRSDGNAAHLGRVDEQIKLHGFRIEPGEIESALNRHPAVRNSAAVLRDDDGRQRLVAYVVLKNAVSSNALRDYLIGELPGYMAPAAVVSLPEFPLTPGGKIDKRALPAPEPFSHHTVPGCEEPQTDLERVLARIWEEVLGVERPGVRDNFFELGGDSILSIQVVSRAREAGLQITPRQLFDFPTISELAQVVGTSLPLTTSDRLIERWIPLTPIQHWFFDQELDRRHHYNQAVMLEVGKGLDRRVVEEALARLVERHDALRYRYVSTPDGWRQSCAPREENELFLEADIRLVDQTRQAVEIDSVANLAQGSLDLEAGPIIRAVWFNLSSTGSARLLIVTHHLAVDGVSWRILLDDLDRACRQVPFPPETASYGRWAQTLIEAAQTDTLRGELTYWTEAARKKVKGLPIDQSGGRNSTDSVRSVFKSLSADATRSLLREIPRVYRTRINDVLLTALAGAFSDWTEERRLFVDIEGHGREALFGSMDVSRTVGWFTTVFPALLELPAAGVDWIDVLRSISGQLEQVPNNGTGYGLLRYLASDPLVRDTMKQLPGADVSFNYLGQLDRTFEKSSPFAVADESTGRSRNTGGQRSHLIEIDSWIKNGRFESEWAYSKNVHDRSTIERVAERFIDNLDRLVSIARCGEPVRAIPASSIGKNDRPAGEAVIDDGYPLSATQLGMLFHSLYEQAMDIYCTQLVCEINGAVNRDAFRSAWQAVLDQHGVLRTCFEWDGVDQPLQIIRPGVRVEIDYRDWRGLEEDEQRARLEEYLKDDRRKGFDLRRAPLLRLALIRLAASSYRFVFSSHHLLSDGWSMPLILEDVIAAYEASCAGEPLIVRSRRPYRDYVAWLGKQDLGKAEAFWRNFLRGYSKPVLLSTHPGKQSGGGVGKAYGRHDVRLGKERASSLRSFSRGRQLTLNTIGQAAWALVCSFHSGSDDVVFGAVMSGRSADLAGIESMVGMFVNTLPVRVKVTDQQTIDDWLRNLQSRQTDIIEFEYSPLPQVQAWSEIPTGTPLFESLFVFQNYPIPAAAPSRSERGDSICFADVRSVERSNFPLTVWMIPGEEMVIRIGYDPEMFSEEAARGLLDGYLTLLEALIVSPHKQVHDLRQLYISRTPKGRASGPDDSPANQIEQVVTRIWREVLGTGARDDFFDAGGRFVLATRLLHAVGSALNVRVPLSEFLKSPTVAGLTTLVTAHEPTPGISERIAKVLNRIEGMSEDEVKKAIQSRERYETGHEGDERGIGCD